MSSTLIDVRVYFTRKQDDGQIVRVTADISYDAFSQWGAPTSILGDNVDAVSAIQDALAELWDRSDESS